VAKARALAIERFNAGNASGGVEVLNEMAVEVTKEANTRWSKLWGALMVGFADGLTAVPDSSNLICGCHKSTPEFSDAWLKKIITDTGDHYRLPDSSCAYIDPDGHCHPKQMEHDSERSSKRSAQRSWRWAPTPKLEVPGVGP
jgi:hypothetical protein